MVFPAIKYIYIYIHIYIYIYIYTTAAKTSDNLLIDPLYLSIALSIFNTEILQKNGKTN